MTHVQTIEKSSQEVQNNHCKKKPNKRQRKMKDSFCFFCLLFEVFEVCQTHFQNICRVFILVWPFHLHHLPPPPLTILRSPPSTCYHLLHLPPPTITSPPLSSIIITGSNMIQGPFITTLLLILPPSPPPPFLSPPSLLPSLLLP